MYKHYLCTLFLILACFTVAKAQKVVLHNAAQEYNLLENLSNILVDSTGKLSFEEVSANKLSSHFKPFGVLNNQLKPEYTYWVKLKFENISGQYAEWILFTGKNDFVDVFIQEGDSFILKKAGIFDDVIKKDIKEGRFSKVNFRVHNNEQKTVYIRYKNISKREYQITPYLVIPQKFFKKISLRNLQQGLFQGILGILITYNFLLFLFNKEKAFLYYALYIACTSIYFASYTGFIREYIITEGYFFWQIWWVVVIPLSPAFYLLFMRSFLNTKKVLPKWDKVFKTGTYIIYVVLAVQLCFYIFTFNLNIVSYFSIFQTLLSYLFMFFCLIIILMKDRNKLSYFFIAGSFSLWFGVFTGTAILLFVYNGEGGSFTHWNQTGVVAELILFSLGLGYKMKKNEEEKISAQNKLIKQLETNKQLQNEIKRELETKVLERTAEIVSQRDELAAQKDFIEKAYNEIQYKNEEIEKKNQDITASISYSQHIQKAMLPPQGKIENGLKNSFILFKPRDIVSGDFYWYNEIINREKELIKILAVVDCTGHGVPGAIMSMIGNDLLTEAVSVLKITEPDEILKYLHIHLKKRLNAEKESILNDAMEIAICAVNEAHKKLEYAGAKLPLVYIENGELKEIQADRIEIGESVIEDYPFAKHTLSYANNSLYLYLFSDGYQDQFGGSSDRKFMKKRLKEQFFSIYKKEALEQKNHLEHLFTEWKRNQAQVDDVLLIGFQV